MDPALEENEKQIMHLLKSVTTMESERKLIQTEKDILSRKQEV